MMYTIYTHDRDKSVGERIRIVCIQCVCVSHRVYPIYVWHDTWIYIFVYGFLYARVSYTPDGRVRTRVLMRSRLGSSLREYFNQSMQHYTLAYVSLIHTLIFPFSFILSLIYSLSLPPPFTLFLSLFRGTRRDAKKNGNGIRILHSLMVTSRSSRRTSGSSCEICNNLHFSKKKRGN